MAQKTEHIWRYGGIEVIYASEVWRRHENDAATN
jgi:hypothetical protein